MIFWSIITGLFWALVIAIVLWILCAYAGKLVNPSYSMNLLQHLLCFAIAIATTILLSMFFLCNKADRIVQRVDTEIAKVLASDRHFQELLKNQKNGTAGTEQLTDYVTENFSKKILSEYPILKRFASFENIIGNEQLTVDSFTAGIRAKIKSVKRKVLITLILLQALPFGITFYRASKHRSFASAEYNYESNSYL
jgi:low affinity Fe/Cu permease